MPLKWNLFPAEWMFKRVKSFYKIPQFFLLSFLFYAVNDKELFVLHSVPFSMHTKYIKISLTWKGSIAMDIWNLMFWRSTLALSYKIWDKGIAIKAKLKLIHLLWIIHVRSAYFFYVYFKYVFWHIFFCLLCMSFSCNNTLENDTK